MTATRARGTLTLLSRLSKSVEITDAGHERFEQALEPRETAEKEVLAALGEGERETLHRLLAKGLADG